MQEEEYTFIRVLKGTGYLTAALVSSYLIALVYRMILARWLGPSDYGILSILVVILTFSSTVFSLGIPQALTKYLAELEDKKTIKKLIGDGISLAGLVAIFVASILYLFSPQLALLFKTDEIFIFQIAAITAISYILLAVSTGILLGMNKISSLSLQSISEKVLKLLLSTGLLYLGLGIVGVAWSHFFAASFTLIIVLFFFLRHYTTKLSLPSGKTLKKLLSFGIPLMASEMAFQILIWVDIILIGALVSSTALGLYDAALPVQYTIGIAISSLATVLFPTFSKINAIHHKNTISKLFNRSFKYTVYLMIPASVGSFLLAPHIISILFGSEYLGAITVFKILSVAASLIALNSLFRSFFAGIGETKFLMKAFFAVALLNLVLDLILLPTYGIEGVAVATVISTLMLSLIFYFKTRSRFCISLSPLFKSVIASFIMALGVVGIINLSLEPLVKIIVIVVAGILLHFILLALLGGFDAEDRDIFRRLARRIKIFG